MHTCSVYQGMTYLRIGSVSSEKLGLCMNCLRKGHIAEKCRAPPMCKKCIKHHDTLLHMGVDNLSQMKPDNAEDKEETHVAALSVCEPSGTNDL